MLLAPQLKSYFSLAANFAVLGLKSTAKFDVVKKKYYELAKIYHPDVNRTDENAQKKFTEITKAYKYITDNYDKEKGYFDAKDTKERNQEQSKEKGTASDKFKNEKRQKTRMEEDEYEDFQEYDVFFKNSKKFRKPRLGEDIYLNLNVTLRESITGTQKEIAYTRYQPCSSCASKAFSACFSCGGKGEIYDRINREKVRCEACSGRGFKNECIACLGASYILRDVKDSIYIEKGTQDKCILKVEYKGHSGFKADNGHLYVTVLIEEDERFRVDGNNIHSEYELDFLTATFGGVAHIETVHGSREVAIEAGTQSGTEIRIFNVGLKSPFSKRMGDQIVRIKIKIPQRLTERQKSLLKRLNDLESDPK